MHIRKHGTQHALQSRPNRSYLEALERGLGLLNLVRERRNLVHDALGADLVALHVHLRLLLELARLLVPVLLEPVEQRLCVENTDEKMC